MLSQAALQQAYGAKRTAHFLHDVIAPSLSVIGFQLDLLRTDTECLPDLGLRIAEIQTGVELLMEQVRGFSNQLRTGQVSGSSEAETR